MAKMCTLCNIEHLPGETGFDHNDESVRLSPVLKWDPPVFPRRDGEQVAHPTHYNQVPGVECIQVVQHFNFNRGNAIKYVWRAGAKGDIITDLKKARQYIDFEIARLESES